MRKLALLAATCAAAVATAGANAAAPEHYTVPINDTFFAPFMTEACGIPVTITLEGTANVTLWRGSSGLVVREHDVLESYTAVFQSPTELGGTGQSFTTRSPGVVTFGYGSGAVVGSTAVITLTGLAGQAAGPGSSISAGLQRLTGTVFGFSPEGIPLVDFDGPVVVEHGTWYAFDVALAQRCEALGGALQ